MRTVEREPVTISASIGDVMKQATTAVQPEIPTSNGVNHTMHSVLIRRR